MSGNLLDEMLSSVSDDSKKNISEQFKNAENTIKRLNHSASLSRVNDLKTRVQENDIDALLELGELYLRGEVIEKDEDEAYKLLLQAAKAGSTAGQAFVAYCMNQGIGTKIDTKTSVMMLASLCKTDNAVAYALMGEIYLKNEDYKKATSCLKRSRDLHCTARTVYNLGVALYKQDAFEDAIYNFEVANKMDSCFGVFEIALCTFYGKGTEKNVKKAVELFELAIKNNDTVGQANAYIGQIYLEGDGVEFNEEIAERHIRAAMKDKESLQKAQSLMLELFTKQGERKDPENTAAIEETILERKRRYILKDIKSKKQYIGYIAVIAIVCVCSLFIFWPKLFSLNRENTNKDIVNNTHSESKKAYSNRDEFLSIIYDIYKVENEKIANCFANALVSLSENSLPVGVSKSEMEVKFNRYAVCDVDGDKKEELILVYDDADSLYMSEYICVYDENNSRVKVIFKGIPYITVYKDGTLKSEITANQPLSDDIRPYQIYKVEPGKGNYKLEYYIEGWDKKEYQKDSKGNEFPVAEDVDNDGFVYVVYDSSYNKVVMDNNDFKEFIDEKIDEEQRVDIIYSDIR